MSDIDLKKIRNAGACHFNYAYLSKGYFGHIVDGILFIKLIRFMSLFRTLIQGHFHQNFNRILLYSIAFSSYIPGFWKLKITAYSLWFASLLISESSF